MRNLAAVNKRLTSPKGKSRLRAMEELVRAIKYSNSILEVMELLLPPLLNSLDKEQDPEVSAQCLKKLAKVIDSHQELELSIAVMMEIKEYFLISVMFNSVYQDLMIDDLDKINDPGRLRFISNFLSSIRMQDGEYSEHCFCYNTILKLNPKVRSGVVYGLTDEERIEVLDDPILYPWYYVSKYLRIIDNKLIQKFIRVRMALLKLDLPQETLRRLVSDNHPSTSLYVSLNPNCPADLRAELFAKILAIHENANEEEKKIYGSDN